MWWVGPTGVCRGQRLCVYLCRAVILGPLYEVFILTNLPEPIKFTSDRVPQPVLLPSCVCGGGKLLPFDVIPWGLFPVPFFTDIHRQDYNKSQRLRSSCATFV